MFPILSGAGDWQGRRGSVTIGAHVKQPDIWKTSLASPVFTNKAAVQSLVKQADLTGAFLPKGKA